jgi:hypothetical protein
MLSVACDRAEQLLILFHERVGFFEDQSRCAWASITLKAEAEEIFEASCGGIHRGSGKL